MRPRKGPLGDAFWCASRRSWTMLRFGEFLQNAVAGGIGLVEGRFRHAISAGEIPSDFPVAMRAIQVTDFARGLTMRALIGTPRKTLLKNAEEAADLVLI